MYLSPANLIRLFQKTGLLIRFLEFLIHNTTSSLMHQDFLKIKFAPKIPIFILYYYNLQHRLDYILLTLSKVLHNYLFFENIFFWISSKNKIAKLHHINILWEPLISSFHFTLILKNSPQFSPKKQQINPLRVIKNFFTSEIAI